MIERFVLRDSEYDAVLADRDRLRRRVVDLEHEVQVLRDAHRMTWERWVP